MNHRIYTPQEVKLLSSPVVKAELARINKLIVKGERRNIILPPEGVLDLVLFWLEDAGWDVRVDIFLNLKEKPTSQATPVVKLVDGKIVVEC